MAFDVSFASRGGSIRPDYFPAGSGPRSDPAERDPWDLLRGPLTEEKLRSAMAVPAFLPYHDELQSVGETPDMRRAYRLMLADPNVKSALLGKLMGVMSLDLAVNPAIEDDERAAKVAEFVDWNLKYGLRQGLPGLVWDILSGALIDGFSVCEKVWGEPEQKGRWKGKRRLADLKPKDVDQDLVLEIDEHKNVRGVRALRYNRGEVFSPRDFVIYSHLGLFDNPAGMSDLRAVYGKYWLLDTVWKLRGMGLHKFALPVVVGEYPDATKQKPLERALSQIKYQNWLAVPADVKVQVLDMAGRSQDMFGNAVRDLREEIVVGIIGSVLTAMTGDGQRGDSGVHKDRADLFGWHLRDVIIQILNAHESGLIRDIVDRNYQGVEDYPQAAAGGVDDKELGESLALDERLQQMGWVHSRKDMEKRYGRKFCDDKALALNKPDAGMGGLLGSMGAGGPGTAFGGERGASPVPSPGEPPDDEGEPRERADHIADILGGLFGDEALSLLGDDGNEVAAFAERAGFTGTITDAIGRVRHYVDGVQQKAQGDEWKADKGRAEGRQKAIGAAHVGIKDALAGKATPESKAKLVEHLSALTVRQLAALKKEYQLSASGRFKEQLVAKLAERLSRGRSSGEPAPTASRSTPAKPADAKSLQKRADDIAKGWSLFSIIRRRGGIDPESVRRLFGLEEIRENGLLGIVKKGGLSIDDMAQILHSEKHIVIPEGVNGDEYLADLIRNKTISLQASEHYERQAEADYARYIEQAQREAEERDVEEARTRGEAAGVLAANEGDGERSSEGLGDLVGEEWADPSQLTFDPSEFEDPPPTRRGGS